MTNWKSKFEKSLISGMKYCFKSTSTTYPELDPMEFYGADDTPGFLDFLISFVEDERKHCFMRGYAKATTDYALANGTDAELLKAALTISPERAWLESEKE